MLNIEKIDERQYNYYDILGLMEINMQNRRIVIKKAIKASMPVMAGYIVLGMGFGIIMRTKSYHWLVSAAMSLFIYAGSMQYVAVDLFTGGATLIAAALTTFMVNARHLFYGISMIDKYRGAGKKKPYMIFALTDETYSLVCGDVPVEEKDRHSYCFILSAINQIYWVTGSLLGSALGSIIPFSTEGIDFALTALFVTVFVEQWMNTRDHTSAILGVVCSMICLVLFGAANFLIPAMMLIALSLTLLRHFRKEAAHE